MRALIIVAFVSLTNLSCSFTETKSAEPASGSVTIQWVDMLSGEFSFTKDWSYPEGVEMKPDGRAGVADGGFAPSACYGMLGPDGIVLKDSADLFYQLLDTTHHYHSFSAEAECYEWDGSDFVTTIQMHDSIVCESEQSISTHCSLHLVFRGDTCFPTVQLNSIVRGNNEIFYAKSGFIKIDRTLWKAGILKAEFSFDFENTKDPKEPVYFKGRICSAIKSS